MNYSLLLGKIKKEIFEAFQYTDLVTPIKILAFIAMFPFWVLTVSMLIVNYIYLFSYKCVASASDYLECWLQDNRKGMHPATEAVLYFVAMPFIFMLRCVLSFFSITFFILWFTLNCCAYIATLGSIEWRPFISEVDVNSSVSYKPSSSRTGRYVIVIIAFSLICLILFFSFLSGVFMDLEEYDGYLILKSIESVFMCIYAGYSIIAVPIAFKKVAVGVKDPTVVKEEVVVAKVEEEEEEEEDLPEF